MARIITTKTLKYHEDCTCGYNFHDQWEKSTLTVRELVALGYKRRKFSDGKPFFFKQVKQTTCSGNHY